MISQRIPPIPILVVLLVVSVGMGQNPTTIDNDVPLGKFGHFSIELLEAGTSRNGMITGEKASNASLVDVDVIFSLDSYIDVGANGNGFSLNSGNASQALTGDDEVTSTGSFIGSAGNTIDWRSVSTIPNGSDTMSTEFTFAARSGTMGHGRFIRYLDIDTLTISGDVLFVPVPRLRMTWSCLRSTT